MTLTVRQLRFSYGAVPVLRGVDLVAQSGQCVCVLGANGAGKTTLFRCVLGLTTQFQGDVFFDAINNRQMTARQLAQQIAYVPQAHSPIFNYTVFNTVLMGTNANTNRFSPGASDEAVVQESLEMVGIAHLAERGFVELSGGERQLVLIARALAQRATMIVMDEPTANLDYGNQFKVLSQVRGLTRRGYLVLLSTHSPEHALLFGDLVVVLQDGVVLAQGQPRDVLTPDLIESVYGIPVTMSVIDGVPVLVPKID